jgi:hypothetical protein
MKLANQARMPDLRNGDDQLWQRSLPGIYINFQDEHTPDAVDGKRHIHFVRVVMSVFNVVIRGQRNITYHLKFNYNLYSQFYCGGVKAIGTGS